MKPADVLDPGVALWPTHSPQQISFGLNRIDPCCSIETGRQP